MAVSLGGAVCDRRHGGVSLIKVLGLGVYYID